MATELERTVIKPWEIVAGPVALIVIIMLIRAIRVIPQARVGVVERLGRFSRSLQPGLHVLAPFFDRVKIIVDVREQVVSFPPQPVITQDNVTIGIDTVIYSQVTDPVRSTYEVANLLVAMEQLTITTLRNVIGALTLEEALTSRDKINTELRLVLDEATEKWGVRVNRVELKSIDPPKSIQEAMEKQMRAERDKRAAILTAEGEKQSTILTAEGERQAAILRAEAQKQSSILAAEGDKRAKVLRAEGEAEAIGAVFAAIHAGDPTPDLLTYKYLEVLPTIADGKASKLFMVPSDALGTLGALAAAGAAFSAGQDQPTPAMPSAAPAPTKPRPPARPE